MNTNDGSGRRRSLWKGPALIAALILVIPVLGNHFVEGWNWGVAAFVLLGTLVFGLGLTYQLVTRNVDTLAYRAGVGVALVAALPLFWMNWVQAADDVNPAALMYFWVLVVGFIGAAVARFRPRAMALALFVTALAQAVVLAIAVIRNLEATPWTAPLWRGFGGNTVFLLLFVGSALLFRKAARGQSAPGAA
jgi:hypothetical protein